MTVGIKVFATKMEVENDLFSAYLVLIFLQNFALPTSLGQKIGNSMHYEVISCCIFSIIPIIFCDARNDT